MLHLLCVKYIFLNLNYGSYVVFLPFTTAPVALAHAYLLVDYRNMSLINQFISEQGKILFKWINRLTLKQQRLITLSIK